MQIQAVENKVSKGIGFLSQMKDNLDKQSLRMIYFTLIPFDDESYRMA